MADSSKKQFIVEPHSPYFLHPSEGPGAMITAMIFDGKNYELWERVVTTALKVNKQTGLYNVGCDEFYVVFVDS